ncbi:hypothetical protein BC628DRAFT_1405757 [Trametes gibbosa]|nr:hypothetical protein BC628DRAFT_1405757 [Trametes gibbosa]
MRVAFTCLLAMVALALGRPLCADASQGASALDGALVVRDLISHGHPPRAVEIISHGHSTRALDTITHGHLPRSDDN